MWLSFFVMATTGMVSLATFILMANAIVDYRNGEYRSDQVNIEEGDLKPRKAKTSKKLDKAEVNPGPSEIVSQ